MLWCIIKWLSGGRVEGKKMDIDQATDAEISFDIIKHVTEEGKSKLVS